MAGPPMTSVDKPKVEGKGGGYFGIVAHDGIHVGPGARQHPTHTPSRSRNRQECACSQGCPCCVATWCTPSVPSARGRRNLQHAVFTGGEADEWEQGTIHMHSGGRDTVHASIKCVVAEVVACDVLLVASRSSLPGSSCGGLIAPLDQTSCALVDSAQARRSSRV
jgi:hypothetical protein